jgi:tryptophan synthase alpha chain
MSEARGLAALKEVFGRAAADDRAVLLPYMTAGLPDVASSVAVFEAMAEAGADGFEVGIPYSDPLMDGPTIHEAGLKSLKAGTSLNAGMRVVEGVASATGKPVIVMSYVNPVLRVGVDEFSRSAAEAGASAVILADLPVDEAAPFRDAFDRAGLGMVLFAAPTTGAERLRAIAATNPVFVYGVAEVGVTGERAESGDRVAALAASVRAVTDIPLVLGVGISTPDQARRAARVADGVIVGSALVRRVLDAADPAEAVSAVAGAVGELAAAVRRT